MSVVTRSSSSLQKSRPSSHNHDRGLSHSSSVDGSDMREALLAAAQDQEDAIGLKGRSVLEAENGAAAGDDDASASASTSTDRLPRSVLLLCLSALLMSLKPSEPFLTNYLEDVIGLTDEQVNDEVYPVWTYAFLAFLLPAGVMAHFLGARSVVLLGFAGRVATRFLLLFGSGVPQMQLMQVTFGLASACEPIMYALVYYHVPRRFFTRCTSLMQSSALVGHLIAGVCGQIMVDQGVELRVLFIISAVSVCFATVIFIATSLSDDAAPTSAGHRISVSSSREAIPLHLTQPVALENTMLDPPSSRESDDGKEDEIEESWVAIVQQRGIKALFLTLFSSYSHPRVLLWSFWVISARGVLELVLNYNTTLFYERDQQVDHDGVVVALGRGAAALSAMIPAWTQWGADVDGSAASTLLVGVDLFSAGLLFLSALLPSLYAAYVFFILFYCAMQYLTSIASTVIARNIEGHERRIAVWTMNSFISLVIQTITQLLLGHHLLHFSGPNKFYVLAAQLALVAMGFGAWEVIRRCRSRGSGSAETQQSPGRDASHHGSSSFGGNQKI